MDTIAAIATPQAESALAVLRVSGSFCIDIINTAFRLQNIPPPRRATLTEYIAEDGTMLDQVLLTYFVAPASFTGESTLEISCHGNPYITQRILEDLLARGCRQAEAGEFARRAFINGRLNLSQAEGIMDLIHARSEKALQVAQRQMQGALGQEMSSLTEQILACQARLEAYIDFPEEDLPDENNSGPIQSLLDVKAHLDQLIQSRRYREYLQEGVKTVILGAPNAGKSSIINRLLGEERALVSDKPGTTRDFLRERFEVGGWTVQLYDTAGLRGDATGLEQRGIELSLSHAREAEFIILVIDGAAEPPTLPPEVKSLCSSRPHLVLLNKCDLATSQAALQMFAGDALVELSAKTGAGWENFIKKWREQLALLHGAADRMDFAINARHAHALSQSKAAVCEALGLLRNEGATELAATELRQAVHCIGEVVGKIDNERMLDKLFASFCIGK